MSFDPSEDDDTGPCNFFCLWTHLHGWRHFALTKNKGFWILWIVMFMFFVILAGLSFIEQVGVYSWGLTNTYTKYDYIWEKTWGAGGKENPLQFPSMTICPESPQIPTDGLDMCKNLGISGTGTNFSLQSKSVITDHGSCCMVMADQPMIKVGLVNGLNLLAYPGIGENGVYMALHEKGDIPLMAIDGNYVSKGTYNPVDIKPDKIEHMGIMCYKRGRKNNPEMKYGFGTDLTMSNCLYDNMMANISEKCSCDLLSKCNDDTKWKCATKILMDPYTYLKDPIYCLEACNTTAYTPSNNNPTKMSKDPTLCGEWLNRVKELCSSNSGSIESGYTGLCSQVTGVSCTTEQTETSYENREVLLRFAKENLINMQFYFKNYWMETHYAYFVKSTKDLFNGILIMLAVIFGFSLMSIPELLYYLFCGKGGGCVCGPIMKNCA